MSKHDESPQTPALPIRSHVAGRLLRLIRKELSEILRDRRTIMTLVLMPLLLYPLLSLAFQQFLLARYAGTTKQEEPKILLGFLSEAEGKQFLALIASDQLRFQEQRTHTARMELPDLDIGDAVEIPANEMENLLQKGRVDLVIRRTDQRDIKSNRIVDWEIIYFKESLRSVKALRQVQRRMAAINTGLLVAELPVLPERGITVSRIGAKPLESAETGPQIPLASLIPLILILMTITGAVYPAIDLTAGERERGTLEVLVAAPVPRLGLLFAKYVSVLTVAMLTALVNLVMMSLTLWVSGLSSLLFGDAGLSPWLIVEIFGLLLLFAAFFSAVLLTITSFARSFKEAQAYLIPLMLVSLAPGLAGMLPGVELSPTLCMVPLLNIVLLGRDLLQGNAALVYAFLVIGSTLIYAAAAIALAARVFGAENVLYNEQASWTDLVRRPAHHREVPTLPNALLCLCLIFFLSFLAQGIAARAFASETPEPAQLRVQVLVMTLLSVLLFAGLPLLSAIWRRIRLVPAFLLRAAHPLAFLGALLLGLSLWPFVLELLALLRIWGGTTMTAAQERQIATAMHGLQYALPLGLLILTRIVPAVVEEFFFRGFLFSALSRVTGALPTIVIAAILFGVSHVAVTGAFGLERLLPSLLMGLILGWVCWKSGCVLPSMLLHGCHNGMLVLAGYWLGQEGAEMSQQAMHVPPLWLAIAAGGVLAGCVLLFAVPRSRSLPAS